MRRGGDVAWENGFLSGEANMSRSVANLERHHCKSVQFYRSGDDQLHFLQTAMLSLSDGFRPEPGDEFEIEASPFELPL
jgi:hypothetical protein